MHTIEQIKQITERDGRDDDERDFKERWGERKTNGFGTDFVIKIALSDTDVYYILHLHTNYWLR
jgi:hypothetical protein